MRSIKDIKGKLITLLIVVLCCGAMYFLGIQCPIKEIFGIMCPGCGMTRALVSMLLLRPAAAFQYHPMVWSLPILFLYYVYDGRLVGRRAIDATALCLIGVGFLCVWLLRIFGVMPSV